MTSSTVSCESVGWQKRGDPCGTDPYPATVSSKRGERQERGDLCSSGISEEQLLTKPTKKSHKPKKCGSRSRTRRPVPFRHTGMAARVQKVLWMIEFLNTETHTPVFLMNHLWSLRLREVWISKTQCFFSRPERPQVRDLQEDQHYKGPVQNTHWPSRTSCRKFLRFDYSGSCEGGVDVIGVVTPLVRGVAQVLQVVELSVQLEVQEVEGKEEDREGQVEVEDERGELQEKRTCTWMTSDETQT